MPRLLQAICMLLLSVVPLQQVIAAQTFDQKGAAANAALDDQQVARFLSEEEDRLLQSTGSEQGFLQRCGNFNPCRQGYDCVKTGLGGKRCFPLECFVSEMEALNFNATEYKAEIFAKTGFTEEDMLLEAAESTNGGEDHSPFETTKIFQSFQKVLRENSEPLDAIRQIQHKCTFPMEEDASISRNSTTNITRPESLNEVGYVGCQFELAAVAEFSITSLIAQNRPFNRVCFGAGPQIASQASFLAGLMTNSDEAEDLGCAWIWFDIDLTPLVGAGIAGGFSFSGRTAWEVTFNFGAAAGAGVSTCATISAL